MKFFISCVVTVAMLYYPVTCKHLRRGNQQTVRPAPMIFRGIFGFPSNYNCFARMFDEPRRMRLQCTKNSDRLLNCKCHRRPGSEQLTCSCRKLHKNGSVPVELESKYVDNNAVFPTEPLEEQRPTLWTKSIPCARNIDCLRAGDRCVEDDHTNAILSVPLCACTRDYRF